MNAKLSKKALNQFAVDHMISYVNSHANLQALPAKMDKLFSGLPILLLAPTREQALTLFNTLKNEMQFKNVPGFAGLLQNTDDNIDIHFNRVDAKGRKLEEARVADLRDAKNEYILVTIIVHDFRKLGQPVEPAITMLRGLADLGGKVIEFTDRQYVGAVVEFPPSFSGTNSRYGGIAPEHKAARQEVLDKLNAQLTPGENQYMSAYQDSFAIQRFYDANPGTPKWIVVRRK